MLFIQRFVLGFRVAIFTMDSENEAISLSCNERNERSDIGAFG